jgi:hexosaminidase
MNKNLLFLAIIWLFVVINFSQTKAANSTPLNLIPYPDFIEIRNGKCNMTLGFNIKGQSINRDYLKKMLTADFKLKPNKKGLEISLSLDKNFSAVKEAYELEVTKQGILITAAAENGIFYGIQTLRQLIDGNDVPYIYIKDKPALAHRAYMLDEARYFKGKQAVENMLDEIAQLKFNKFHWHLTDDTGWRIEIKKYPLLTEVGSKRDSTQINDDGKKWQSEKFDGKVHQGFYTQKDIKEIIKYAEERYITIIPEISMPGHASAAVASYPWLGTLKEKIKVPTKFGVESTVFNPADDRVIAFLHDVLREVATLFPSEIIHIGGDEVKYGQWKESGDVIKYMQQYNLQTYSDVQVKFTNDMSNFIDKELNKKMMGWNEILGAQVHDWSTDINSKMNLSSNAIIHFWYGKPEILKLALDRGHQVVNSHNVFTYMDYTYDLINLQKAYSFNPVSDTLSLAQQQQIIGIGCQMWGEWTPSIKEVEYQTFPRIAAYAEVGWTSKAHKNYSRFRNGVEKLMSNWERKGYNIAPMEIAEKEIKPN